MNVKNRKCIQRLSWRSLWASKNRNIIAIIAIALTTLMFTALFTIGMSMNSSYEMYSFRQAGGYCHGTFKGMTDEQAKKISEHSKIKATGKRILSGFIFSGKFEKTPAEISYMDDNCAEWSFATPTVGHNPKGEKDITMDTKSLELLGIKPEIGAKIELTYTVGFLPETSYDKTDTFTLVGWWEYDNMMPTHYINVSEEHVKKTEAEAISKGQTPFSADLNVMTASSINIEGTLQKVAQDIKASGTTGTANNLDYGVNWGYTASMLTNSIDITTVLAIMALVALVTFTGYLIIYNIFQISVTGDIRFYGLLKTIGVTPKQLSRIIRQQALLLCAIGIPIGLLLGFGIGVVLTPKILSEATTLSESVSTVSFSPVIFVASTLFSLITVLLSCYRPGKIAGKVSPVEATKYTEVTNSKKKSRATRGAKIHQMAFANLGRQKSKTFLVVISLSLSVVLFNILVTFTNGFDMEKYLAKQTCADFIVGSTDYFTEPAMAKSYITYDQIADIKANTKQSLSGCGYTLQGIYPISRMDKEAWLENVSSYPQETIDVLLAQNEKEDGIIEETVLIEGLDTPLFEKLTVIEGDITPMLKGENNAIAMVVDTDDYGKAKSTENFPAIGSVQTITYTEQTYAIDSRTGERANDNTPVEFIESPDTENKKDVDYTICAYVTVPNSMSHRYFGTGYSYVLPVEKLEKDSNQEVVPMFYLFDTANKSDEDLAESYLAELTSNELSGLMYNSKTTVRQEFTAFQNLFLLMGGLLCAVIGIVGILNFFNAIMTSIISRKREFAVLQAVGMTSKQLKTMLIYEGLFYALSSALVALVLSLALNPLTSVLLENMFWFFSPNFTIIPVLIVIPIFAMLGLLIPYILYNQASKHSVVERLREN